MFKSTTEVERLTAENAKLRNENAELRGKLDNAELEFYRLIFSKIQIPIKGEWQK